MKPSKQLLVAAGVVIVLVIVIFVNQYNLFARSVEVSNSTVEDSSPQSEETVNDEAAIAAAREAEEKAKEEARIKREADIELNSRYVMSDNTPIYKSLAENETVISTLSRKTVVYVSKYFEKIETVVDSIEESNEQDESDIAATPAIEISFNEVTADADNIAWVEIKSSYDALNPIGVVPYEALTGTLTSFIDMPYDNVDYEPFEKTMAYESNPPVDVKGVYVTGNSASTDKINQLIKLADETEINTFIIDVKDDNGYLLFHSETAETLNPTANNKIYIDDIKGFIETLKAHNIYLIARIVTFKSPIYARQNPDKAIVYSGTNSLYSDADGLIWASAHNRELWEYNVGIAKEAAELGFNEIQFDYVRFPAISNKSRYDFRNPNGESQVETIQGFLKYAYGELSPLEVYVGADVFGWAATAINDVGIGQHWEAVSNVVDFICPMVYPSHYGPNIFGLPVPDAEPYKTILQATKDAKSRNSNIETPGVIRAWIQDFTATWVKGHISYGAEEVKAQIKALNDEGITSYMLWNSRNNYSEEALK